MPWFAFPQTKDSDTNLAKIAEGASRRHGDISPVTVKDTHLMNNKLSPAENLCGEWIRFSRFRFVTHDDWVSQSETTF